MFRKKTIKVIVFYERHGFTIVPSNCGAIKDHRLKPLLQQCVSTEILAVPEDILCVIVHSEYLKPVSPILVVDKYVTQSQLGRACRRGVIFKKIRYWSFNTPFEASNWFRKQYPGS